MLPTSLMPSRGTDTAVLGCSPLSHHASCAAESALAYRMIPTQQCCFACAHLLLADCMKTMCSNKHGCHDSSSAPPILLPNPTLCPIHPSAPSTPLPHPSLCPTHPSAPHPSLCPTHPSAPPISLPHPSLCPPPIPLPHPVLHPGPA